MVFCGTLVAVLATDLLEGIAIGIGIKVLIHLLNGAPLASFFKSDVTIEEREGAMLLEVSQCAVFSNWIGLKKKIQKCLDTPEIVLDLSETQLVDHTVMQKLHDLQTELQGRDCTLLITGLERHRAFSDHPHAARKRRLTV